MNKDCFHIENPKLFLKSFYLNPTNEPEGFITKKANKTVDPSHILVEMN